MSLRIDRNAATPLRIRRNFQRMRSDAVSRQDFIFGETPSGLVNSSNQVFILAHVPSPASSVQVILDGVVQTFTTDYTFSGSTITFVSAPTTGSVLRVNYIKR